MRKMMWMACLCMLAMLVANCGKKISETQELAEKYMEAQKNEDVDAMFDLMHFENDNQKEGMKAMVKEKITKKSDGYKKVKSYSFVEETVDAEKGTATVKFDIVYDNDSTKQDNVKLKKYDGKWMVDSGK
ncbi:MAG: DUF4878 domain-containing protein [Prevotella sp.]|nr:DUF4878 domain-containing protein [Prevotella sp.]